LIQIATLDATLRIFEPDFHGSRVRAKRYVAATLFSQGELGRAILDLPRDADGGPLSAPDIATRAMPKVGTPDPARTAVASRIRSNLTYLKSTSALS
jgi:hypothetical protein